jgi:hypothetical protein
MSDGSGNYINPLVVVMLGAIFLGLTLWWTRPSQVPRWRSGVLAVVEHGLRTSVHQDVGSCRLSGMDRGLATAVGKEKMGGDMEVWTEDISVRLWRRGLRGRGYGLTVT